MPYRYCPLCGEKLIGTYKIGQSYPKCPTGHYTYFPNQSVGAAAIICEDGRILLERRAISSGYGLWALPGGMVEQGESIEQGVTREVLEETGLHVEVTRLLDAVGGKKVCIVFYEARVLGGVLMKSEESLELRWFAFGEVPFDEFAFPRQREALSKWLQMR